MQISSQHSNIDTHKSTVELKQLMETVLELAKKVGASDAAVVVNNDKGFSVDVRMGSVETVAFSADQSVSVTVYDNKRKGSASSTDVSYESLKKVVEAAYGIAKVSAEDPCFGLAEKKYFSLNHPDLDLFHPWEIDPPRAIELALECENHALSRDKKITNSDGVNVSTYEIHHGWANSQGGIGLVHGTRHNLSCSLIATEGDAMQRDYDYSTAREASKLQSAAHIANNAVDRALSRLGARQIATQETPVIFSSRVSSSLFSSFINAISGANLYRKNTFLLDSIGKSVFPQFISIYEQPYLKGGLGSSAFDGEGVTTRENRFVENGIVQQYALGCYSARRMGLETTGNSDGVHNLHVDANAGDLKALLQEMGTGLLITELMGQGINGLTGDYSRGASGYWIENGVIQYPVDEITIAGNLLQMYQSIIAVGNDFNPNISTICGSVWIEKMMVAGK